MNSKNILLIVLIALIIVVVAFALLKNGNMSSDDSIYESIKNEASRNVLSLCSQSGEVTFSTPDGFQAIFRGPASSITSCDGSSIWQVKEEQTLTESGTFYFDSEGELIDVCQLLHRPGGCERFQNISCLRTNICL